MLRIIYRNTFMCSSKLKVKFQNSKFLLNTILQIALSKWTAGLIRPPWYLVLINSHSLFSWLKEDVSNMAIVDVKLVSGFSVNENALKQVGCGLVQWRSVTCTFGCCMHVCVHNFYRLTIINVSTSHYWWGNAKRYIIMNRMW